MQRVDLVPGSFKLNLQLLLLPLPLDGSGEVTLAGLTGGGGPISVFMQVAVPDAAQIYGYALSNALRADFLP